MRFTFENILLGSAVETGKVDKTVDSFFTFGNFPADMFNASSAVLGILSPDTAFHFNAHLTSSRSITSSSRSPNTSGCLLMRCWDTSEKSVSAEIV